MALNIFVPKIDSAGKASQAADEGVVYDVIIVGAGPAGLTAAIYSGRARQKTLVMEKLAAGGQILVTEHVENYPGFDEGVTGAELGQRFERQARKFGAEIVSAEVEGLGEEGPFKIVKAGGKRYKCQALIVATGAKPRKLGVEGENRFIGRGVSTCATCDAAFFREKEVLVVGGGDTAIQEAVFLTRFCKKVTIVHRRDSLRAAKILQEKAFANPKIGFIWDSVVQEIKGLHSVEAAVLKNVKTGAVSEQKTDGIFVFVGVDPQTEFLKGFVDLDESGYILANMRMETSRPGVFCCGDAIQKSFRQVSTSVGEGAQAAFAAEQYLCDKA